MSQPAAFTPEQQALHDHLKPVDTKLLAIAREVLEKALPTGFTDGPDPEDLGAPVNTPAWAVLGNAFDVFDETATGSDEENGRAALDVLNAILAGRT